MPEPIPKDTHRVFLPAFDRFNTPGRIAILLGSYLSTPQMIEAQGLLLALRRPAFGGETSEEKPSGMAVREARTSVYNTRSVHALNRGRKWALTRLTEQIAPMLEADIALAIVPSHDPWTTDPPMRELARMLAALDETRVDATACLVRHTRIARIVFGGPSTQALHRETIRVERPELVAGRRVLLLDDIAKSGRSLVACRAMLYQAGATTVQMAALGRVT